MKDTYISFPQTGDNICGALDESSCTNGEITTGLFWASLLASELYANWVYARWAFSSLFSYFSSYI
jgi:hypothetical protein